MSFLRPELLPLAFLLPMLVVIGIFLTLRRRRRVALAFGDPALMDLLAGPAFRRVPRASVALLGLAAAALGLAAANPRWGPGADTEGTLEVALVLDASGSMYAADVSPTRLEQERTAARALVRGLPAARFGLVAFAGNGHILTPLTTDVDALELYLDALSPETVTQGGSSLSSAMRQGTSLLLGGDSLARRKVMVVISDGEALEGEIDLRGALAQARRAGVTIHTVGVGTERGARVPDMDPVGGDRIGWKRDPATGAEVISRLDRRLLTKLARETGGRYHNGSEIGELLETMEAGTGASGDGDGSLLYPWLVGAALLFLACDSLLELRSQSWRNRVRWRVDVR